MVILLHGGAQELTGLAANDEGPGSLRGLGTAWCQDITMAPERSGVAVA
jgi:hypothetical protein